MRTHKAKSPSYSLKYEEMFALLEQPLKGRDGVAEQKITSAEKRLGIKLPTALREYYLVAGQQNKLNRAYNRLLRPSEWYLHKGKLCFMEENQGAVVWGTNTGASDAAVYQSPSNEDGLAKWYLENRKCSAFLMGMLVWQSTFGGGLPHTGSILCSKGMLALLEKNWNFVSEINGMRTYVREGQAASFLKWFQNDWCVFVGATTPEGLALIKNDLK
ncbi:MAG TPA: hypothetical protein VGH19_15935 [Verrucomicrobiae bacterium]